MRPWGEAQTQTREHGPGGAWRPRSAGRSHAPAPGGVHARVSKGSEPGRRADDPGRKGAVWGLGPGLSLACGVQGAAGPRGRGHRALGVGSRVSLMSRGPGASGPAPAQGNRRVNKKIRSVTALWRIRIQKCKTQGIFNLTLWRLHV